MNQQEHLVFRDIDRGDLKAVKRDVLADPTVLEAGQLDGVQATK